MTIKDEEALDRTLEAMNRSFEEFFSAVGYAITRWADIDRELFRLCKFALNTDETKTSIVFYRIKTIGEHLALVDKLMKCSISDIRLRSWQEIYTTLDKLLEFRNDLAHNSTGRHVHVTIPPPHGQGTTRYWWSSRPDSAKRLLKPNKPTVEIETKHVLDHINKVNDLHAKIDSFRARLPKRPLKKLLESSEQEAPRRLAPSSRTPRRRPKPKRPPRSSPS